MAVLSVPFQVACASKTAIVTSLMVCLQGAGGGAAVYKGWRWEWGGKDSARGDTGSRGRPGDDFEGQAVFVKGLLIRKPSASTPERTEEAGDTPAHPR